jgi:hypothetical protein
VRERERERETETEQVSVEVKSERKRAVSLSPYYDVNGMCVYLSWAMCAVVVSKTSCKDRNHRILRGVIAPHQDFFFFAKIMILLDF